MIKYTLMCKPGTMLRTGIHVCIIGQWIRPDGYIILTHGVMTYHEYRTFTEQGFIRVYDRSNLHWLGIYGGTGRARWMEDGELFVGKLYRNRDNIYIGRVSFREPRRE